MFDSDRNQTGSRRFKPNSCIILLNEQFNFLQLLHRKVMIKSTSRSQPLTSLWTLSQYNSVIPGVVFIWCSNSLSLLLFGSLNSSFDSVSFINLNSLINIWLLNFNLRFLNLIYFYRLCYVLKDCHPNQTNT